MPDIKTPPPSGLPVKTLADFLRVSARWQRRYAPREGGMLSQLWYRGVCRAFDRQAPGVYRPSFEARATRLDLSGTIEDRRLRLERDMLSQFRTAGASFLTAYSRTQVYFVAQHFGMP